MLDVEAALAQAHAQVGNISQSDADKIAKVAFVRNVKPGDIRTIEAYTKHDIVALIQRLSEVSGKSGTYVHLGATSSDITDTATALQLKEALELIEKRVTKLSRNLFRIGLVSRQQEFSRHAERLHQCKKRVLVGKMTGSVGTQAAFGNSAEAIQQIVMKRLGLQAADITTQMVPRDNYAELICHFAIIATSLENLGCPQNPEIAGLARMIRSFVAPAFEDMMTSHERDLTQSSAERFIIPQACIIIDYMLAVIISSIRKNLKNQVSADNAYAH